MTSSLMERARMNASLPKPHEAAALRVAAGLSQEGLAGELEVTASTISRWESGVRAPRGRMRVRYAEALDDIRRGLAAARDA